MRPPKLQLTRIGLLARGHPARATPACKGKMSEKSEPCNSDGGQREKGDGRRLGRAGGVGRRGLREQRLSDAQGWIGPEPLRAERRRGRKRREARRGANRVASNHPHAHGGARTLSKGVKKLSSSFRILASALARASGASSNTSRVKVTKGNCVQACWWQTTNMRLCGTDSLPNPAASGTLRPLGKQVSGKMPRQLLRCGRPGFLHRQPFEADLDVVARFDHRHSQDARGGRHDIEISHLQRR